MFICLFLPLSVQFPFKVRFLTPGGSLYRLYLPTKYQNLNNFIWTNRKVQTKLFLLPIGRNKIVLLLSCLIGFKIRSHDYCELLKEFLHIIKKPLGDILPIHYQLLSWLNYRIIHASCNLQGEIVGIADGWSTQLNGVQCLGITKNIV